MSQKTKALPEAFAARMQQQLGEEFPAFSQALAGTPPTSIRYNPFKKARPDEALQQVQWCEHAVYLPERPDFYKDPLIFAGAYYVQEASSMFIDQILRNILSLQKPLKILDLCAAPGGKSTLIASAMPEGSLLVSNEIVSKRALPLAENIMRWGNEQVLVSNNNPQDFEVLREYFDLVLVDAPCSGEGMFRKDPKVANLWNEGLPIACAQRQSQILESVDILLKPGGHLIYSTCTFAREENEAQVLDLVENKGYHSKKIPIETDWQIAEVKEQTSTGEATFAYRFYPHKTKGEGFFAACLQKEGEFIGKEGLKLPKKLAKAGVDFKALPKKYYADMEQWVSTETPLAYVIEEEQVIALPKENFYDIKSLNKALRIRQKGVLLGKLKNNKFIPDHALTMSRLLHPKIPRLQLNYEQAVNYLKKQEIEAESQVKGWAIATYNDVSLGWCKVLPNRINNYYPTELRIRKDFEV